MIFQQKKLLKQKKPVSFIKNKTGFTNYNTVAAIWQILPEKPIYYLFLIHSLLTFDNSNCF